MVVVVDPVSAAVVKRAKASDAGVSAEVVREVRTTDLSNATAVREDSTLRGVKASHSTLRSVERRSLSPPRKLPPLLDWSDAKEVEEEKEEEEKEGMLAADDFDHVFGLGVDENGVDDLAEEA